MIDTRAEHLIMAVKVLDVLSNAKVTIAVVISHFAQLAAADKRNYLRENIFSFFWNFNWGLLYRTRMRYRCANWALSKR